MQKIVVLQMTFYGEKTQTQQEVIGLFHGKFPNLYPVSPGTLNKRE